MTPQVNRLDKKTFDFIMKAGRPVHSALFTLRYVKNPDILGKFAFVAPKSVEKQANKRNYLRRKGYNALRPLLKGLKASSGIFFIKKEAKNAPFEQWTKEVGDLVDKLKWSTFLFF